MEKELPKLKQCPICKRHIDYFEMYCECDYEFGGNRCINPDCGCACGDFECFCSVCGGATQNYYDGFIGGIPTNVK